MDNHNYRSIVNGIITGCASTIIFNPIDRALYLMVKDGIPIYSKQAWKSPYSGVHQALYSRIVGYGLYFPIYDLYEKKSQTHMQAYASVLTGITTTLFNHPINVIKMNNWNNSITSTSLVSLARNLKQKYGLSIFLFGIQYTLLRDISFSFVFFKLSNDKYFSNNRVANDFISSLVATIIASPINYYRNALFFSFQEKKTFKTLTKELVADIRTNQTFISKVYYIVHNKLNVGFGTLRVGAGMAFAKYIYEYLNAQTGISKITGK